MADTPTPPNPEGIGAPPSPQDVALKGLCPRCGAPTLFAGPMLSRNIITFAPACRVCGLDMSMFNVGDGPAAFLTLILGSIITALAIWLELAVSPPWWVHLIWIPITLGSVLWSLRLAKGALIALEYRNAAREGRIR